MYMNRFLLCIAVLFCASVFCSVHASTPDFDSEVERVNAYLNTEPDSAVILADRILSEYGRKLSPAQKASFLLIKGNGQFNQGQTDAALSSMEAAISVSREAADTAMLIEGLSDAGILYRVSDRADKALEYYNEALALVRAGGDKEDESALLTSIACLYANTGRIADAVPYARKAARLAEETGELEAVMYACSQAGAILFLAGEREEGLDVERRILALARTKASPRHEMKTYTAMIHIFNAMELPDSADRYIAEGEKVLLRLPEGSMESVGFMEEVAKVLSDRGEYAGSQRVLQHLLELDDAVLFMPKDKLWLRMARNYSGMGMADSAAAAYERSIAVADSLRAGEIDNQLSEFNVRYGAMEKELEIAHLREEQARGRTRTLAWLGSAVLLIVILVAWLMVSRRRQAVERIRQKLRGVEEERERVARDLHDGVCSDLYAVRLMMHAGNPQALEELKRVDAEVRNISHELMPPAFSRSDLLELLEDLSRRTGGFLRVRGEDGLGMPSTEVSFQLYRIVQELTANIRKHTDAPDVSLSVTAAPDGALLLSLAYQPLSSAQFASDGGGIGLETIRTRTELIGAHISRRTEGGTIIIEIKTEK